jgi:cell division protein FtsN
MANNLGPTHLLKRAISLFSTLAAVGALSTSTFCARPHVRAKSSIPQPVSFLVSNSLWNSLWNSHVGDISDDPKPTALGQGTQQTRPRRVNPGDPAAQPSPAPRTKADGAPKSSEPRRPARPDPPNSKLPPKAREPAAATPLFTIQVGAFLQADNARRLAQSVSKKGYSARVISLNDSHGKKWYCVRVGNYHDRERALKTAGEIETKLKLKPIVRSSGSL